jgi:hypothetical protein
VSGSMYAGQLCATQVGGKFDVNGVTIEDAPYLVKVIHGGARNHKEDHPVRVLLYDAKTKLVGPLIYLRHNDVVLVEDPS